MAEASLCEHLVKVRIDDGPWLCQYCHMEVKGPTEKPLLWLIQGEQPDSLPAFL